MKKHLLLLLFLVIGCNLYIKAQDTIDYLVISEIRMDEKWNAYIEFTNMGSESVDLSKFGFGAAAQFYVRFNVAKSRYYRLPAVALAPGESFVSAQVFDLMTELNALMPYRFRKYTKPELWDLVDAPIHTNESALALGEDTSGDSVSIMGDDALYSFTGNGGIFLMYHLSETDSVAVDQVNLVFDAGTGNAITTARDVAGVVEATRNHILVRKYNITQGNMNWDNARGIDLADSEWLPIPRLMNVNIEDDRAVFWTVGNHGNYSLDETTLVPLHADISVNWAESSITIPWGIRNNDHIMEFFERKPGIAWHYDFSPNREDSAYTSARTGDVLTLYVLGNELHKVEFDLIVQPPKATDNLVIPKNQMNIETGDYTVIRGNPFEVTMGIPMMDTIYEINYGTSVDTLLKYLEKPQNASWEIKFLNDEVRASLKTGDILKVTAESGAVKEYFLKLYPYVGSTNARLSAITWPDIPEWYYNILGWKGDTIPGFSSGVLNYTLLIPFDVEGIPALSVTPQNLNTEVEIIRATNLRGSAEDRTIIINTVASDGKSTAQYRILLVKEKNPADLQPWKTDPFISQYSHREQQANWGSAFEFMNPGNQSIDMSDYMFVKGVGTPAALLSGYNSLGDRMNKYIFGYQWADTAEWNVTPGKFVRDFNVNPIVEGGDVFVLASLGWDSPSEYANYFDYPIPPMKHWNYKELDVNFRDPENPWKVAQTTQGGNCVDHATLNGTFWLFRIENDSIKRGLKPANDPNDFTVIDIFGKNDGANLSYLNEVNGALASSHKRNHIRKPSVYKGNPVPGAAYSSTSLDSCEWKSYFAPNDFNTLGYTWKLNNYMVSGFLGSHEMNEVNIFKSTISSLVYIPSEGYSYAETIRGISGGTTVDQFIDNLIKADTGQTLMVKSATSGLELIETDAIANGDSLIVLSADKTNTTKYIIELGELSDNAVLTSATYTIDIADVTGTISGFGYEMTLAAILENINVPAGASLTVVDENNVYVPLKKLNNDTVYMNVTVTDQIFFVVLAEDGKKTITYQLKPNSTSSDAFIVSSIYEVDQTASTISLVLVNTNVNTLLANVTPVSGASIKIVDKLGFERVSGSIHFDDKLLVTAADGETQKVYFFNFIDVEFTGIAYISSEVYNVDLVFLNISGTINSSNITIGAFLNDVTASAGATVKIVNSEGVEKAVTDLVLEGDKLKLTVGEDEYIYLYTIDLDFTSAIDNKLFSNVNVYPNPSAGWVTIDGIVTGTKIKVYNTLGIMVDVKESTSDIMQLSLEHHPNGLYIIIIEKDSQVKSLQKVFLSKK
jgi:Fe-S cluster assembly iron-binding protein IscA